MTAPARKVMTIEPVRDLMSSLHEGVELVGMRGDEVCTKRRLHQGTGQVRRIIIAAAVKMRTDGLED